MASDQRGVLETISEFDWSVFFFACVRWVRLQQANFTVPFHRELLIEVTVGCGIGVLVRVVRFWVRGCCGHGLGFTLVLAND